MARELDDCRQIRTGDDIAEFLQRGIRDRIEDLDVADHALQEDADEVERLIAIEENDHLAGSFTADVHVQGGDGTVLVADARREIPELDDVDVRLAQVDLGIEQLRERGGRMTGTNIADFLQRIFLKVVEFERLVHYASTLLMVSRIFGGWKGFVMNDFAPA